MKVRFFFTVLAFVLLTKGFSQTADYKFHSVFIYNFTKYIQWPATQQSGDFVIAVMGNSPVFDELSKITANKTVGTQKIVVKKFNSGGRPRQLPDRIRTGDQQLRSRAGKAQGQGPC
jgi:hypothetical protein